MVSPAFTGFFFAFAAMVLLIFASVSPPAWQTVNFLNANVGGSSTVFGVFGKCVVGGACDGPHVGYDLVAGNLAINDTTLHRLTYALILHPIAGGLAFIAFLFGMFGVICASRFMTIMMALTAALGALAALVIFIIDMVLWNIVKNKVFDAGGSATLGNANWFTVGACVSLFLSFCTSTCGACGRFATGRMAGEKY